MLARFEIGSSRTYLVLLSFAHCLAFISIWLTGLPFWARAGISVLILLNLLHHLQLYSKQIWRAVTLEGRHVFIQLQDGNLVHGDLTAQTVITPYCVVLSVKIAGNTLRQVVFQDAMPADDFRQLRVRLNYP